MPKFTMLFFCMYLRNGNTGESALAVAIDSLIDFVSTVVHFVAVLNKLQIHTYLYRKIVCIIYDGFMVAIFAHFYLCLNLACCNKKLC